MAGLGVGFKGVCSVFGCRDLGQWGSWASSSSSSSCIRSVVSTMAATILLSLVVSCTLEPEEKAPYKLTTLSSSNDSNATMTML